MSQSPYFWDHFGVRITVLIRDLQHSRHTNVCIWPWLALVSIFENFWMLSNFSVADHFCIAFCKDTISYDHMPTRTVGDWFKFGNYWVRLWYMHLCVCACVSHVDEFPSTCCVSGLETKNWQHELGEENKRKQTSSAGPSAFGVASLV